MSAKVHLISLAVVLLLATTCWVVSAGDVPPLVNYQGTLTDQNGEPLTTGSYTISFSVYDAKDATSPIWGPQVFDGTTGMGKGAQVQVVNGAFNVILGPKDTAERPIESAFASPEAYLGIKVGDSAEISPRQAILSAPYALVAGSTKGAKAEAETIGTICSPIGDSITVASMTLEVSGNRPVLVTGTSGSIYVTGIVCWTFYRVVAGEKTQISNGCMDESNAHWPTSSFSVIDFPPEAAEVTYEFALSSSPAESGCINPSKFVAVEL